MNADLIINELKSFATEERRKSNEWFFKTDKGEYGEGDKFIGVRVPQTRLIAKKYFKQVSLKELEKIIKHPVHELRHLALIILVNKYQSGDKKTIFDYYLKHLNAVNNWDLVDTTTPQIVGDYIFNNQDKLKLLYDFSLSKDLWQKRIAIVATFALIKKNQFEPTLIISKTLLSDKHDLIHKAVGWMLREVFKKDENVTKKFLRINYQNLPRTTLRYAIERMNEDERQKYLKGKFNVSN